MKAKHKYNPKTREGARRIAQSYGYKHTIYDDPEMVALLYRAGITIAGIDYSQLDNTTFTDDTAPTEYSADTETLKL
jgi:hypothetical protein